MHHAWQSGAEPVACEFRGEVPGELSLGLLGFNPSRQRRLNFTPQTPQTCVNLNVGKLYHFARPTSLNIFGEGSKPSSSTSPRFHQPIFFQLRFALLCYPLPSNHKVLVQSTPDPRFSQPCTGVNACLRVRVKLGFWSRACTAYG